MSEDVFQNRSHRDPSSYFRAAIQAKFLFLGTQALVVSVNFLQHQTAGEGFVVIVISGLPMQQGDRLVLWIEKIGGRGWGGSVCGIGGSVVEFSPPTRETRVRFPANAGD